MPSYFQLLLLILPVFALIGIGIALRRANWIQDSTEASLIRVVINLCMPCLIFESIVANPSMHQTANVMLPPVVGFGTTVVAIAVAYGCARLIGLQVGTGLRTFALAAGLGNYGYLPLQIMPAMFGPESRGVLLVHNVGVEAALWTVGVVVLSGASWRAGWRRLASPIVATLLGAIVLNLAGFGSVLPAWLMTTVHSLAVCAVPLGLLMTGTNLATHLREPRTLFAPRVSIASMMLRFGLLPLGFLALARWLPCEIELKRVIIVQGAMPAAVIPIIVAQHFGGRPIVAVQIVLATTALGVLLTPWWLQIGLAWISG